MFAYYLQLIINVAVGFVGAYLLYYNSSIPRADMRLLDNLLDLLGIVMIWAAVYLIGKHALRCQKL